MNTSLYFLYISLFLVISSLFARCKEESYSILPPMGSVPSNARFLIEGFGNGQRTIENIAFGDAFLVSNHTRIPLIPQKLFIGQYLVSQILLKPSEPLLEGTRYTIVLTGIDPSLLLYQNGDQKGWVSNGVLDIDMPVWRELPMVIDRKTLSTGNSPAEWVRVSSIISDHHSAYVFVKLKNIHDKQFKRTYILPVKNSMVLIGHGACSGPFNINSGARYSATLIPMDLSGNLNERSAKVVYFSDTAHR